MDDGVAQDAVGLVRAILSANRASDRKRHPTVDRLNVEFVLLTAIALDLEFQHIRLFSSKNENMISF